MAEPFPYDRVVKDMLFQDRPRFLNRITGGQPIREIVASDLPRTLEKRADMVLLVDPAELHHLEFQSSNYADLPYRQGIDCFLLAQRYKDRLIRQSVIYFGDRKMRMPSGIDVGAGTVSYRLIDIREFDALEIAEGGSPADLVLATLARGGPENLPILLERICGLAPAVRNRALAQIALLSGLRRMAGKFKIEVNRMGLATELRKNEFLRDFFADADARGYERGVGFGFEKGMEKGMEEGEVTGARTALQTVLEARFGSVPAWALTKIHKAPVKDLRRWIRKSVQAPSLEAVLGRK